MYCIWLFFVYYLLSLHQSTNVLKLHIGIIPALPVAATFAGDLGLRFSRNWTFPKRCGTCVYSSSNAMQLEKLEASDQCFNFWMPPYHGQSITHFRWLISIWAQVSRKQPKRSWLQTGSSTTNAQSIATTFSASPAESRIRPGWM